MADRNSHLIEIIVRAIVEGRGAVDKVAGEVERLTKAEGRHAESTKRSGRAIQDVQKDYADFTAAVRHGEKDFEVAQAGLKRLSAEMDQLSKKEPFGSKQSEELIRQAASARRLAEEMKKAHVQRKRDEADAVKASKRQSKEYADEWIRQISRWQDAEKSAVDDRKRVADNWLADVRRTLREEERERVASAARLARLDAQDQARQLKVRVDAAAAEARRVAGGGSDVQPVTSRPSLIQRIRNRVRGVEDDGGGVRRFSADVDDAGRSSSAAEGNVGRLTRAVARLGQTSDRTSFSIARIDNNLRGLMVIGVVLFSQQLISVLVTLGGMFLAVASAAAQAGAAIGGAMVAGIGQAIPTIGLLIAAFGRIGAVFDAVQLFNKQATKSGYDQAQAAEAQASAADRLSSANEQVVAATRRVTEAVDAVTAARERARQKIQDLNLAERASSRSAFEAEVALRRGGVGDIEELTIRRDQARLQSSRAATDASGARSRGVGGSDEVQQALQTLEESRVALARSRRELDAAGRAATRAADTGSAADRSLEQALAELTAAEQGLYASFLRIQKRARSLFRPITDIIVRSFSGAVDRVTNILGDDRIIGPLRGIADQVGRSIERITDSLTSEKGLNFFEEIGRQAEKNIPLLTTLGIRVNEIFSNIAIAAGPALTKFIEFFVQLATKGAEATSSESGLAKLERFFLRGEEYAESFVELGIAVFQLFAALAGAGGAETGINAIEQLTVQAQKATAWVRTHQEDVRQFFADVMTASQALARMILAISKAVIELFRADAVTSFAHAFETTLLPALTSVIRILGVLTTAFLTIISLPVINVFAQWGLSTLLFLKVLTTLGGVMFNVALSTSRLLGGIAIIGPAFMRLGIMIRTAATLAMGPWGLAIAAVIAGIALLDQKLHFLKPTFDWLIGAFNKVNDAVKDAFGGFNPFLGILGLLITKTDSVAAAEDKLEKAQRKAIDTQRELTDARRQARRELSDLESAAASGRIQVKEATFALTDAERDLAKLRRGGANAEDVERAEVRVDRARLNLRDTTRSARRAEQDYTEKKREGVEKNAAVVEAEKNHRKSVRAVGKEQENTAKATEEANDKSGLSIKTLGKAFKRAFQEIADVGRSGINLIIRGYNLINDIPGLKQIIPGDHIDLLKPVNLAQGDIIKARPGGTLARVGEAGADEVVLTSDPKHGSRTMDLLHRFLDRAPHLVSQFAKGGFIQGAAGQSVDSLASVARGPVQKLLNLGYNVTSAVRSDSNTYHSPSSRTAVDFGDSANNMQRLWATLFRIRSTLSELFGPTSVSGGTAYHFGRASSIAGTNLQEDHEDHIHAAFGGGKQGGIKGLIRGAAGFIKGAVSAIPKALKSAIGNFAGFFLDKFGADPSKNPALGFTRNLIGSLYEGVKRVVKSAVGISDGGDMSEQKTAGKGNVKQIRSWLYQGLKLAGVEPSSANITKLLGRVMQESGGDPNSVNNWDSNAKAGDPSRGILQTIGATFRKYMVKGHDNIFNPVDNIAAAVRYMIARYGKLVGRGSGGYEVGGAIPGSGPQMITAHGGEHVITAEEVARAGGHGAIRMIRRMLGGGGQGGSRGYKVGGEVKKNPSYYIQPELFDTSLGGMLAEIKVAQGVVRRIKTRGEDFVKNFTRSLSQISGDGGLLEQASASLQRVVDGMATMLKRLTYSVRRDGTVVQRLSETDQEAARVAAIDVQRTGLEALRGGAQRSLTDVDRRLKVLKRGGIKSSEAKAYVALVKARRELVARIDALDSSIADAVESRFQAQERVLQSSIDEVNKTAQRKLAKADLGDRVATLVEGLVGGSGTAFGIRAVGLEARRGALTTQRDALGPLLGQALSQGNNDLAADLVAQIEDLNVSLAENTSAMSANTVAARQASVEAINRAASRQLGRVDLQDRVASLIEAAGNSVGAFGLRRAGLTTRNDVLGGQRSALEAQLLGAQIGFDGTQAAQDQIDALADQIADLDVTIQENVRALDSNTVAARQAAIDRITGRGGFLGGISSGLSSIITTIGAITGSVDVGRLVGLAQDAARTLKQTGSGLRDQLLSGFGLDLRGLSGSSLVDRLRTLDFDAIESSFSVEQRQQFEALIQAIIDNEGALQTNTQQIRELTQTQQQSFSSTAWQMFRQAIFDGSGGLLPRYSIPAMETGGTVLSGGMAYVHPGEVVPARISRDRPSSGGDTNVYVTSPTEVLDPGYVASVISYRRSLERAS